MKPVTLWFRLNDKTFEFNHTQDGHVDFGPQIKHANQSKAWPRATWKFEHAHLTNDIPPKVVR